MIEDIGAWIKQARKDAGMTQAALAGMLNGITAADISKAERGLAELMPPQLEEIATALGAAPETLTAILKAEPAQEPDLQPAAPAAMDAPAAPAAPTAPAAPAAPDEAEWLELYRKADPAARVAAVALLKGDAAFMPVLTALFGNLVKTLTLSGGPIAGIINNVMGLFDANSDGSENPLVTILNGVTGIVSGVMSMKAACAKEKPEKPACEPAKAGESAGSAGKDAKAAPAVRDKAVSGPLLGFTFSYAVVIYLLLLSFYFWLWRTDITPDPETKK